MFCERVPPHNKEAEIAVVGSILINNNCWNEVFPIINSVDFYLEYCRVIFFHMEFMFSEGKVVDPVTLGSELTRTGNLNKVGGALSISNILDNVVTTANVSHYANIIKESSAIRKILYDAQKIVSLGFGSSGIDDIEKALGDLEFSSRLLRRNKMPDSLLSMGDDVLENYSLVEGGYRGVELPWKTLDNMTAGLWPKTITMFVARPSIGKTQIAVICGKHAWESGKKVLMVSPEMSKSEIAERFFVTRSQISYHGVVTGGLPTVQHDKLKRTAYELKELDGLWIIDSDDDLSPSGIDASIRACKPDLVAIDSMYDLKIKGERRDRMISALEWIKKSSNEYNYSVLGFAQQNRKAELSEKKGGGTRLGTIALADEISQDAHSIFALEQTKDEKADKIMNIKVLKLRRGQYKNPVAKIKWDWDIMDFSEITEGVDISDDEEIPF